MRIIGHFNIFILLIVFLLTITTTKLLDTTGTLNYSIYYIYSIQQFLETLSWILLTQVIDAEITVPRDLKQPK